MRDIIILSALATLPLSAAGQASPLASALEASSEGPLYAYDMTLMIDQITASGSIDPSQPVGNRVTVTSPPESEWDDDFRATLAEIEEEAEGDIWCDDFGEMIGDAKLVTETDTVATYSFTPGGEDFDKKIAKHLQGKLIVDKVQPGIVSLSLTAPKPFKPAIIAKITQFDMNIECGRSPDGRRYVQDMNFSLSGSAAMQKLDERMERSISNLRKVSD